MNKPMNDAWMILKEGGYRTEENPHDTRAHNDARIAQHDQSHGAPIPQPSNDGQRLIDLLANEENSYGDTSNREHPLHGQEGYEDNARGGRGHALDLHEMDETPSDFHSQPKTLDEHRLNQGNPTAVDRLMEERQQAVDRQGEHLRQFNHFDGKHSGPVQDYRGANDRYRDEQEGQAARGRLLDRMAMNEDHQASWGRDIENQIGQDEQREGQQGEADEMDAMGVEPMGRTLSATPPANIGQAGSLSDANPEKHSINPFAMDDAMNTFRPHQELQDWAQTHGPSASAPARDDADVDIEAELGHGAWDETAEHAPLQEGADTHSTGGTMGASPRHERRGQEGAGRAHDRPGFRSAEHMPLQDRR